MNRRGDAIFTSIDNLNNGGTNPDSGNQGDNPNGNGSDGNDNPSPSSTTTTPPPGDDQPDDQPTEDEQSHEDTFLYERDKVSPAAFVAKVEKTTKMSEATRYLAATRWNDVVVPTSGVDFKDVGTSFAYPFDGIITGALLKLATLAGIGAIYLGVFAFSNITADVMVNIADSIAAMFAGGGAFTSSDTTMPNVIDLSNPDNGNTLLIISSLFLLVLLTSIVRAFNPSVQKTLQQRLMDIGINLVKFLAIIVACMFVSTQSKANQINSSMLDISNSIQIDNEFTSNESYNDSADIAESEMGFTPSGYSDTSIGALGSWKAGSMGWIISLFYWFSNMFAKVVVNLLGAFLKTPIEFVTVAIRNEYDKENSTVSGERTVNSCDRYYDALHVAFNETAAAQGNASAAMVLLSLDKLYYNLFFTGYSQVFGGSSTSAQNTWCWALEVNNQDVAPGEWAMLARTAGLYKEAIGSGSLLGGTSATTAGLHVHPVEAGLTKEVTVSDGVFVKGDGNFVELDTNKKSLPVLGLSRYMGRESIVGAAEAKYHFAGCIWPNGKEGYLNPEWNGVRAMGPSGAVLEGERVDLNIDDFKGANHKNLGGSDFPIEDNLKRYADISKEKSGEDNKYHIFLHDGDCFTASNFAIGHEKDGNEGEGGEARFGFGAAAGGTGERWNYNPLPPATLGEAIESGLGDAASQMPGISLVKGSIDWVKAIGEDETLPPDPNNRFGSNMNPNGKRVAIDYWQTSNGRTGFRFFSGTIIMIASGLYVIYVVIIMLPAAIINLLLGCLLIIVPFMMIVSALLYIMRTTRGKA